MPESIHFRLHFNPDINEWCIAMIDMVALVGAMAPDFPSSEDLSARIRHVADELIELSEKSPQGDNG